MRTTIPDEAVLPGRAAGAGAGPAAQRGHQGRRGHPRRGQAGGGYRRGAGASHPGLEFLLLRELAEHAGHAVSKGELLAHVWGYEFDPGSNVVDVCVRRLRSKLGFDLIKTVRGEGYRCILGSLLKRISRSRLIMRSSCARENFSFNLVALTAHF